MSNHNTSSDKLRNRFPAIQQAIVTGAVNAKVERLLPRPQRKS
jgi:hypothetical protein